MKIKYKLIFCFLIGVMGWDNMFQFFIFSFNRLSLHQLDNKEQKKKKIQFSLKTYYVNVLTIDKADFIVKTPNKPLFIQT